MSATDRPRIHPKYTKDAPQIDPNIDRGPAPTPPHIGSQDRPQHRPLIDPTSITDRPSGLSQIDSGSAQECPHNDPDQPRIDPQAEPKSIPK